MFTCILKTRNGFGKAVQHPEAPPFLYVPIADASPLFEKDVLFFPKMDRMQFYRTHIDEYGFVHYEERPE